MTQPDDPPATEAPRSDAPPQAKEPALATRAVRGVLRRLRIMAERTSHARRRATLIRNFRKEAEAPRILVLCLGNICRSPYAAMRLADRLGERAVVRSGGFLRSGRASPPEAVAAAAARGVALDAHRSLRVDAAAIAEADLVVVMEPGQRDRVDALVPGAAQRTIVLGELDPAPLQTRAIPDPWGRPPDEFVRCYERVDRCVDALADLLDRPR